MQHSNSPPQQRKASLVERAQNAIEAKLLNNTGLRRVSTTPVSYHHSSSSSLNTNNKSSNPVLQSSASLGVPFFTSNTSSSQHGSISNLQLYSDSALPVQDPMSMNIDDYVIGDPIGYGSSAVVYIAKYKPLNIDVAIKMIDLDMFERNQIDELRREIQIMSLSKHPNLLPVYGSFVNGAKLLIVTPFLSSGSCLDIMKTAFQDGMDEVSIATILRQALEGLVYLHKNGLIHRDVKAGNLLIHEDGLVQLADFGVSSSLMDTGERKGLRKTFVGTPCWMAPEVMEQSGYDYKADIWSFGITALELATGHAPFAKYPPLKVLMLTLQNEPPTLDRDSTKYKYSKLFKEMIDMCLVKDPVRRPAAEKLLSHPFFKQAAKKRSYLVTALLSKLPPITQRAHNRRGNRAEKEGPYSKGVSWDFTTAVEELGHLVQNREGNELTRQIVTDASGTAFVDPESGVAAPEGRKGVSFAADAGAGAPLSVKKSRFTVGGSPVNSPNTSSAALAIDIANGGNAASTPVAGNSGTGTPVTSTVTSIAGNNNATAANAPDGGGAAYRGDLDSSPNAGSPPAGTPISGPNTAANPGEVRKGRFSVNQSGGSGSSATGAGPSISTMQSSPSSSSANLVADITKQTNSPVEARDNEPPLERKPSRFAVQSLPNQSGTTSTPQSTSSAPNTPLTAPSAAAPSLPESGSAPGTPTTTPTQGGETMPSLPRSLSDRRGRFEVTTSEKPPLAPSSAQQQTPGSTTSAELIDTLYTKLETQRAVYLDITAALAQKGLSMEQLGVHVPTGAFAPIQPVQVVDEQRQQPPIAGQDIGAISVGGVEWLRRENEALRREIEKRDA